MYSHPLRVTDLACSAWRCSCRTQEVAHCKWHWHHRDQTAVHRQILQQGAFTNHRHLLRYKLLMPALKSANYPYRVVRVLIRDYGCETVCRKHKHFRTLWNVNGHRTSSRHYRATSCEAFLMRQTSTAHVKSEPFYIYCWFHPVTSFPMTTHFSTEWELEWARKKSLQKSAPSFSFSVNVVVYSVVRERRGREGGEKYYIVSRIIKFFSPFCISTGESVKNNVTVIVTVWNHMNPPFHVLF